jgi:CMP-N-acetylneuraminic acid synthetase
VEDLENSFNLLRENEEAYNIFSVNDAARNPYFNMVEENSNGFYSLIKTNPDGIIMTRQSAPKVYDLNASFYWYKRYFFDMNIKSAITNKSLIYVMNHICFDLDHPVDFLFMEFLLQNGKLNFKL